MISDVNERMKFITKYSFIYVISSYFSISTTSSASSHSDSHQHTDISRIILISYDDLMYLGIPYKYKHIMYVSDVAIAIIRKFMPSFILLHIFGLPITVMLDRFYFTFFHSFIHSSFLSFYLSTIILMNLYTITYSKEHSFPIHIRKSEVLI